jgi:hypothetical protein
MIKSRIVWLLLVVAFIGSLVFVRFNFAKAFSIVNINIAMDRNAALHKAAELKEPYGWGPSKARSSAIFDLDEHLRNFVELEAGGKEAFNRILKGNLLSPYTWRVRFFREGEVNETSVEFTPDGQPYGFLETLSENAVGPTLAVEEARAIAEKAASKDWHVDFAAFQPVETSKDVRPEGRVDHTFVYERRNATVGEGRYRLRLVVSGDRLTELSNFLKIPESFDRRYDHMRSANDTIATGDAVLFYILYLGIGCIGGLFFLLRRRYLLWKTALLMALVVAVLGALSTINCLPISWMEYNTAESAHVFVAGIVAMVLKAFVMSMLTLGLSFMVAESLTRRAFPHMIQLWKTWRPSVVASPDVLGQTLIGFLMIGFLLAYDVAIYLAGNNWLGWWAPSETLVDPNILSTYLPWLTPLANALHAGFWEECLFRAVPLSCAALIGARLGRTRLIMGITLVVQALIFGAAHANYPNQPAYARIVEIAPAFLVFGIIYLRFGLLPVIVAHFGVDMFCMSLPIFFTHTSGIWADRLVVALLIALPLGVVLAGLAIRRSWRPIPDVLLNRAWIPVTPRVANPAAESPQSIPLLWAYTRRYATAALGLGLLGVAGWTYFSDFHTHTDRLAITRIQARTAAKQALTDRGLMPTGSWDTLTTVLADQGQAERYIWQEHGPAVYDQLQKMRNLTLPAWQVRFVRFDPSIAIAERAETFEVLLAATGEVVKVVHRVPEAWRGTEMTEEAARVRAKAFLADTLKLDTSVLKEISTLSEKKPNRTDWNVNFAYTNMPAFTNNEVQVSVSLANGAVVDYARYFHAPEKWTRDEDARAAVYSIVTEVSSLGVQLVFIAGMVVGVVRWSRHRLAPALFFKTLATLFIIGLLAMANNWPTEIADFSTAQPWMSQCFRKIAVNLLPLFLVMPIIALLVATADRAPHVQSQTTTRFMDFVLALGVGLGVAVVLKIAVLWTPEWQPNWPKLGSMNTCLPLVSTPMNSISLAIIRISFMAFVLAMLNRWTVGKACWLRLLVLLPLGIVLAGRDEIRGILPWLGTGTLLGVVLFAVNELIFRQRLYLLPVVYAAVMSVTMLREVIVQGFTGAIATNSLAIVLVLLMGWVFSHWLAVSVPMRAIAVPSSESGGDKPLT